MGGEIYMHLYPNKGRLLWCNVTDDGEGLVARPAARPGARESGHHHAALLPTAVYVNIICIDRDPRLLIVS